jgi:hypothetical protein
MPTIIGIPAGKMIRTSVVSDTDDLGLTRLTETYAFATSEFQTFRTRLINFTPYNTVMGYVYPTPSTSYPYVLIESVSIAEDIGGISMATVQYHGILKSGTASTGDTSWLPPAKQRLQPYENPGSGVDSYTVNPVSVVVDFIFYSSDPVPEVDLLRKYGEKTILPTTINGTNLYRSLKAPYFISQSSGVKNANYRPASFGVAGSNLRTQPEVLIDLTPVFSSYSYCGMLCKSHFSEKKGLFFAVTNTYEDVFARITSIG